MSASPREKVGHRRRSPRIGVGTERTIQKGVRVRDRIINRNEDQRESEDTDGEEEFRVN